jgi:uncharacterized protein (DUF1501 family)
MVRGCKSLDQPVGALLTDLDRRGLLKDTLVLFGGEFGRQPLGQSADGRDHQVDGFTMWLAGAGVRGGTSYGSTDEYGQKIATGKMHIHDLNATLCSTSWGWTTPSSRTRTPGASSASPTCTGTSSRRSWRNDRP